MSWGKAYDEEELEELKTRISAGLARGVILHEEPIPRLLANLKEETDVREAVDNLRERLDAWMSTTGMHGDTAHAQVVWAEAMIDAIDCIYGESDDGWLDELVEDDEEE